MAIYHNKLRGYFKCCNFCGHAFSGPPGARAYIVHLRDHHYYGQIVTGWKQECWMWYSTGQEREYLRSIGQPIDDEIDWLPEEARAWLERGL